MRTMKWTWDLEEEVPNPIKNEMQYMKSKTSVT